MTFASHFLFPSVRWFFRKRADRLVARLNTRLKRPIEPFKLARRMNTINRLTHDPQVAQAILDHARTEGIPENVAFETARRYAGEIVPGFSATLYFSVAMRLARWLSQSLYRVRVTGEERAFEGVDPDATVIFVLNHRSNMDYVLVTWLAARQTALAYAVGEWARRWPLAPLIRALGGYFVRRRDLNPLYRKILARYVQLATDNGVTQAVFPEGRLSRDGALHSPKLGILSYILEDFDPDRDRNVVFVPVAMNYDRVLEDRVLIAAETSGPRAFRLRWYTVVRYLVLHLQLRLTRRFTRFGIAAVAFGRPLSLADMAFSAEADPTAALGEELMLRIAEVLPVLPMALICDALCKGATTIDAVVQHVEMRAETLRSTDHPVHAPKAGLRHAVVGALSMLQGRKLLRVSEMKVHIPDEARPILRFYARTLPRYKSVKL